MFECSVKFCNAEESAGPLFIRLAQNGRQLVAWAARALTAPGLPVRPYCEVVAQGRRSRCLILAQSLELPLRPRRCKAALTQHYGDLQNLPMCRRLLES
jgi:hypothetical protein